MANLSASTTVQNGMQQYGIFAVNTVSGGGAYLHIETSIPAESYCMYMIEAVGYSYSTAKPIRCAWYGYTYAYNIAGAENTTYNGMTAESAYYGISGYMVIKAYLPGQHFTCITLNAYMVAGNGAQTIVSIRRSSQNNTSGSYY